MFIDQKQKTFLAAQKKKLTHETHISERSISSDNKQKTVTIFLLEV